MSEYFTPYWEERKWITSFDSSAGYVFITQDKAVLWTDGRYLVQAKNQLTGTGVDFYIEGTKDALRVINGSWMNFIRGLR